ncbi:MAG TPA: hypothetical protein ENH29_08775 [Bacteroidetes bacterium]|nr:hypothetical protein [Bacteroidota bacterium]
MDLLNKVKDSLDKITKTSAEVAREGVEKISGRATAYTKLSMVKMEIKSLEKKVENALTEMGREIYERSEKQEMKNPAADLKPHTDKIRDLKAELTAKEDGLKKVYKEFARDSIDKEKIKNLKKELETGGGTIEQIRLTENSPVLGKKLKSVKLPKEVLIGTITRNDLVIIPDGTTVFAKDDKVTLLGKKEDVMQTIPILQPEKTE